MAKRGTFTITKFKRLYMALKVPEYAAAGLLEMLWHLTAKEAPAGNIGKLDDEDIALGVGWDGEPQALIDALVSAKWLRRHAVHRLVVHDWSEHADDATKKLIARKGLVFADKDDDCQTMSGNVSTCPDISRLPEPEPEPEPSQSLAMPEPGGEAFASEPPPPPWWIDRKDLPAKIGQAIDQAKRKNGKPYFPDPSTEPECAKVADKVFDPGGDDVADELVAFGEWCSRQVSPKRSDPYATLRNWLGKREADWRRLKAARAREGYQPTGQRRYGRLEEAP